VSGPDKPERPEGVGEVLRDVLGQPKMRPGVALGRLVLAWEEVVGPQLARETRPWALEEGHLVVAASTAAWGAQVRFLAENIRLRSNETLRAETVRSVRVTVRQDVRKALGCNASEMSVRDARMPREGPSR
jgi:predicted nucleic acid-binding Zn ribbon protein